MKIIQVPKAPSTVHILSATSSQIMKYDIIDIFVNCIWVDTRWQQYGTHLHTNGTQNNTIWEECRPCPVFVSYTVAFALQLRKKHGKTSVRVAEECHLAR